MSKRPLASVIITSYNYERFLRTAIDSSINQTYANLETIVVDDGSTDRSVDVIKSYGRQITPVLKQNGGQGSAFNAGFEMSRGEIVFFLDSDDALLPTAVENAVDLFSDPEVVKVHWPLLIIDQHGEKTGKVKEPELPRGDFRQIVLERGPMTEATLPSAPTSGNAYKRSFLDRVMPIPEQVYTISPDAYLFGLAPAFGIVERASEPQGFWRFHGLNASKGTVFEERLRRGVSDYEQQCMVLRELYLKSGMKINVDTWKAAAWWPRIDRAIQNIRSMIPEGETFILADGDGWGTDDFIYGRRRLPFIERNGHYWGAPLDDNNAIEELERLRGRDVSFIVFGWPVFWWFEYFKEFHNYLRSKYRCVAEDDLIVVFGLR